MQSIPMPVPTGSSSNIAGSITIPTKMEPTKSEKEMASRVDAKIANQSIPMPVPTDSARIDESEMSSTTGNETTYIIEEIVTEEVVNGKKRITTQTITRRANQQNSVKSLISPVKNSNVAPQPSLKMPVAVGSEMEQVKIPAKMTPTRTETSPATEGIVEMPMNLPKPTVSKIETGVPNFVESELNTTPISEIVDEDRPSAIPMPSVPVVAQEVPKPEITDNFVSSPKLMAEEQPAIPAELALGSQPVVEPGFAVASQPKPVETGFNFNSVPTQSVEAGFNFTNPADETRYMSIPPESVETTKPDDAGFNFRFTDEQNMPLPMPIPGRNGSDNMMVSNSPPTVPNLLALSSANKKQDIQAGYLAIPQPLPPSAIEDNQVIDDDKSDVSHGSKKIVVSSPKVFTADEEIKFSEQLADNERLEHEEALKNESPITNMPMPKTPSTYFKNNNLSDNEGASDDIVKVGTPASLPTVLSTQPSYETQKMRLTVVNQDEPISDSDSDSDDEKLITIKKQYEQKKKELEARIGSLQGNIVDTKEESPVAQVEAKEEVKVEDVKAAVEKVKEEINEEVPVAEVKEEEVPAVVAEVKEEIPAAVAEVKEEIKQDIPATVEEVKEEIKQDIPAAVEEVKEKVKEDIPAAVEEVKEEIKEEEVKAENEKGKMKELKNQISSTFKKHQRNVSNSMNNLKKKVDESFEQTKEHLKETKDHIKENLNKPKSQKSKEELNTEVTTTTIDNDNPVTETEIIVAENENVQNPGYPSSEASFNTYLSSSKKSNRPKSIKSFFGFSKKDKKDKKEKKANKIVDESIPEFPEGLSDNTDLKEKKGNGKANESKSPFSFKRFVSPFTSNKRRTSNASLKSKNKHVEKSEVSEGSTSTIPDIQLKTEVVTKSPVQQDKPLPIPKGRPVPGDMNKVIADVKAQGASQKFVIPEEALARVELENEKKEEKKEERKEDDNASIHSQSSTSSTSSASSVSSSASSASSASSSASSASSSSSDEEVLGNIVNKKQQSVINNNSVISHHSKTTPIPIETKKPLNRDVDLQKNYTQVDNDDFVSLMMVQRMLSSSVDRSASLDAPTSPSSSIPEMPSGMINPYSFVDVEAEKRKSYSKPKAIVTAVNPRRNDDPVGTPRSTILYKFDERPKLDSKNNFYRNEYSSRSVGSLPIAIAKEEDIRSAPKQRMVELNLDNSVLIEDKENAEADNRKSTLLDSNLMQMFDDIHNLSLDDITSRYTKPSMIQCDIGPSFLDEVMGSLSMDKH
ncbi:hypothetical protein PIROE2DRAFT_21373 [Piromyces sp. E2]|nr:hypothetical protein PIROE2DRAFT_21373 [Piromyces sp. E2]|eukprot:OUM58311.1 hypothetical protein PIROE2DRAFT_21373 [Piromyces sp. E2]